MVGGSTVNEPGGWGCRNGRSGCVGLWSRVTVWTGGGGWWRKGDGRVVTLKLPALGNYMTHITAILTFAFEGVRVLIGGVCWCEWRCGHIMANTGVGAVVVGSDLSRIGGSWEDCGWYLLF